MHTGAAIPGQRSKTAAAPAAAAEKPKAAPRVAETTALGAAYAAGIAVGFWNGEADVTANWVEQSRWQPAMADNTRSERYTEWKKAVTRTLDWVE